MRKYFAKLFGLNTAPRTDQVSTAPLALNKVASATAAEESASVRREASTRFMRLVTAHLGDDERRRLMEAMLAGFDAYGNLPQALEEIALSQDGQKSGQWLIIQCDWKASEEVEWQIAEVATSFGIPDRWRWGAGDERARTVPGGLCEAANWAAPRGFEMLHLDLGCDTYFAILIRRDDAQEACRTALSAGLKVLRTPEFALSHA